MSKQEKNKNEVPKKHTEMEEKIPENQKHEDESSPTDLEIDKNNDQIDGNHEEALFAAEVTALKELANKKEAESREHYEKLTYMAAEFDNYKKRTQKEKERIYSSSIADVITAFLPTVDNFERAIKAAENAEYKETIILRDGVAMVAKQMLEAMEKLGVREIDALGKDFDPAYHHAVMHIEDETFGSGEVVDVFQKGYLYKDDTVIRHAMVKVAN